MKNIEGLVKEISNFLSVNNLFEGVEIYYNDKRITKDKTITGIDIEEYLPVHNVVSMTFEGKFYDEINYGFSTSNIVNTFKNIIRKYGYDYKQYESWNLTLNERVGA